MDGEIFTVNGSIPSVGDNNVSTNYIHYDYIATSGTYYYALSSVDFQGNITPYGTITLPVIFDDGDFQLYQINNQQLQLHMHTTCGSDGVFSIWDTKGQLMFKQNLELNEGENNQTISIPDLSKGIYYATIVTARKQYKGQFIRY
ncbi:MAG: T9SS type A sorting domain-containing protein [Chitinophagaceae bacterium]